MSYETKRMVKVQSFEAKVRSCEGKGAILLSILRLYNFALSHSYLCPLICVARALYRLKLTLALTNDVCKENEILRKYTITI